jgi:hypothetical protein
VSLDLSKIDLDSLDQDKLLLDIDREDCEEDLVDFVKGGWKYIDPNPYVHDSLVLKLLDK